MTESDWEKTALAGYMRWVDANLPGPEVVGQPLWGVYAEYRKASGNALSSEDPAPHLQRMIELAKKGVTFNAETT
ncbi:hypothetical protein OCS65_18280 [Rhodococcus aetherivorans]|uniref:Uncharacterized protein n=1 Tax=Rhodococcus aetherivorans TaxID=191292 RepID=A0AA46NYX5_9NOCA|nr:hypothetical protein [Rhodococcus aetherivorans]UYF92428.1 hypothetical protein OCS65_18280 [Rhodococcus aetherivorans]